MPLIPYETVNFPAGTLANGISTLNTSWDDILWSAVTVGRPNRQFVFRNGTASLYEALFRWSLVRMALEQFGPHAYRIRRTNAAKTLDPSEKGAVNYFLGMTFCKLFAAQLLNIPWLLHLDVFRPMINLVLTGRSRPDLVGFDAATGQWHAFESKGRASSPDTTAKQNAKTQAQRLIRVSGTNCTLHIGAITYFKNDVLNFYWVDPEPVPSNAIDVSLGRDPWRDYYQPIADLISGIDGWRNVLSGNSISFEAVNRRQINQGPDLTIEVFQPVAKALSVEDWNTAHQVAIEFESELRDGEYQLDGLKISAGKSWLERYSEFDTTADG